MLAISVALWALAILAGFTWMVDYSVRPGRAAEVPLDWPADSLIEPCAGEATVLMFIHPRCTCSRASIAELGRVMENSPPPACYQIIVSHAADFDWEASELHDRVAALPDVHVILDETGDETRRFGAYTSGFTLAYDAQRRLVFQGGITSARGHYGPNLASESLATALAEGHRTSPMPVFGCPTVTTTSERH